MDQYFVHIYLHIIYIYIQMFHVNVSEAYREPKTREEKIDNFVTCIHYATWRHVDHRRNDSKQTPYINHLVDVASTIVNIGLVTEFDILRAALLKDIVHGGVGTLDEIAIFFGARVADLVAEVTDDMSLTREQRMDDQILKGAGMSYGAKIIRQADKLCNMQDFVNELPVGWTEEHRDEYFSWTFKVISKIRGYNFHLEQAIDVILTERALRGKTII